MPSIEQLVADLDAKMGPESHHGPQPTLPKNVRPEHIQAVKQHIKALRKRAYLTDSILEYSALRKEAAEYTALLRRVGYTRPCKPPVVEEAPKASKPRYTEDGIPLE